MNEEHFGVQPPQRQHYTDLIVRRAVRKCRGKAQEEREEPPHLVFEKLGSPRPWTSMEVGCSTNSKNVCSIPPTCWTTMSSGQRLEKVLGHLMAGTKVSESRFCARSAVKCVLHGAASCRNVGLDCSGVSASLMHVLDVSAQSMRHLDSQVPHRSCIPLSVGLSALLGLGLVVDVEKAVFFRPLWRIVHDDVCMCCALSGSRLVLWRARARNREPLALRRVVVCAAAVNTRSHVLACRTYLYHRARSDVVVHSSAL